MTSPAPPPSSCSASRSRSPPGTAVNARVEDLLDEDELAADQAAEIVAALGGGYCAPVYDAELADKAWLDAVAPDAALPTWKWGPPGRGRVLAKALIDDDM